jgi:hypothetical protein
MHASAVDNERIFRTHCIEIIPAQIIEDGEIRSASNYPLILVLSRSHVPDLFEKPLPEILRGEIKISDMKSEISQMKMGVDKSRKYAPLRQFDPLSTRKLLTRFMFFTDKTHAVTLDNKSLLHAELPVHGVNRYSKKSFYCHGFCLISLKLPLFTSKIKKGRVKVPSIS